MKAARVYAQHKTAGFTIVELIIVIIVIGILAGVAIVGYGSWKQRTIENQLKSDLQGVATAMESARNFGSGYPSAIPPTFSASEGVTLSLERVSSAGFCIEASSSSVNKEFYITQEKTVQEGSCPILMAKDGDFIQTITSANCPDGRIRAVDARDNHTYWVKKLDGKCWMLTNLAYAGGGANTYSDTKTLLNGTSDSATTYTAAKYYIPSGANVTTEPTNPSTSTNGTGQYGYLYNWCGAMGNQVGTAACMNATTPAYNPNISICPAGWRLPVGAPANSEFTTLNTTINNGSSSNDEGLRTEWFFQYASYRTYSIFYGLGTEGFYWSSSQFASFPLAYGMFLSQEAASSGFELIVSSSAIDQQTGASVRCVAN